MFTDTPCICVPIVSNSSLHPSETSIVGLYLHFIDGNTKVINFTHPDVLPTDISMQDLRFHEKSLVFNKKSILNTPIVGGIDCNSYLQYYVDDYIDAGDFYPKAIETFHKMYYSTQKFAQIVPFSKWIEFAQGLVAHVLPYYKPDKITTSCIDFCEDFLQVFTAIERVKVPIGDELKFQNYMWYTATSRPSNAWNGFNFSAMNKHDGTRQKLRSRFDNGKIVQFDYDAFHIKLLAKILQYEFDEHPYVQIKRQLNLDIPYDEVKNKVFQNIYGTITHDFLKHPFFQAIQVTIDELYNEYLSKGYIESYFYKKRFRAIEEPTPNKVFNYFLQSLETEYNVQKLKTILKIMDGKQSLLVLYLYDAFVFDVEPTEFDVVHQLKGLFETDMMTTKCSVGNTFGDIEPYL